MAAEGSARRRAAQVAWAALMLTVLALITLTPPPNPRIRFHAPAPRTDNLTLLERSGWSSYAKRLVYKWGSKTSVPWSPDNQAAARAMRDILHMFHELSHKPQDVTRYEGPPSASGSEVLVVTAASTNHFKESKDLVASVQRCLPASRLLYYDLGLSRSEARQVVAWCRVQYRAFNFRKYPKRVSAVKEKRFKPLIINEVMFRDIIKNNVRKERIIFWADASIRLSCGWDRRSGRTAPTRSDLNNFQKNLSHVLRTAYREGFVMFSRTKIPSNALTHPNMYRYLPTNKTEMKQQLQLQSGLIFFTAQYHILFSILKWFALCALLPDCLHVDMPFTVGRCRRRGSKFANCHRQDQSVLNILAFNHFNFSTDRFYKEIEISGLMNITRGKSKRGHVSMWMGPSKCKPKNTSHILEV